MPAALVRRRTEQGFRTCADWSDEQLERMEQVGNAGSNAFFEARLPPGTVEALTDLCVAHLPALRTSEDWH